MMMMMIGCCNRKATVVVVVPSASRTAAAEGMFEKILVHPQKISEKYGKFSEKKSKNSEKIQKFFWEFKIRTPYLSEQLLNFSVKNFVYS